MSGIASQELVMAGWSLITVYMVVVLYFVVRGAVRTKDISDYALGISYFHRWRWDWRWLLP